MGWRRKSANPLDLFELLVGNHPLRAKQRWKPTRATLSLAFLPGLSLPISLFHFLFCRLLRKGVRLCLLVLSVQLEKRAFARPSCKLYPFGFANWSGMQRNIWGWSSREKSDLSTAIWKSSALRWEEMRAIHFPGKQRGKMKAT